MLIREVKEILKADVLCGEELLDTQEVHSACGSDLMSDVLAYVKDQGLLLTGLLNLQVIRTVDMMDMKCVVFVRGKRPDDTICRLAETRGVVVMSTPYRMYTACGLLFKHGLNGEEGD